MGAEEELEEDEEEAELGIFGEEEGGEVGEVIEIEGGGER